VVPGDLMTQTAPFPQALADLVARCSYRPGWLLALEDTLRDGESHDGEAVGLTLVVTTLGFDTYNPDRGQHYRVNHYFPVPAATYNERSWQWWLFERLLLVERHEAMEFFVIGEARPYAPMHGPGNDPYLVTVERSELDTRTNFRGEAAAV
jgi:hypothetical protein